MKVLNILLLACLVALAGCASTSTTPVAEATVDGEQIARADTDPEKKMRCRRYKPTGSHRTQLVCESDAQADAESRHTQDGLRRKQIRDNACISCGGDG